MRKAASVFLRAEIGQKDAVSLLGWLRNEDVTRFLNEDPAVCGELTALLERAPVELLACHLNSGGRFFLICTEEHGSIGFVRLQNLPHGEYEIVFAVGREELWGHGYGSQAVSAALSRMFFEHRAEKLTAKIRRENSRSVNTVRGCGFRRSGESPEYLHYSITMEQYLDLMRENRAEDIA